MSKFIKTERTFLGTNAAGWRASLITCGALYVLCLYAIAKLREDELG